MDRFSFSSSLCSQCGPSFEHLKFQTLIQNLALHF
jgi:hypothetical protein